MDHSRDSSQDVHLVIRPAPDLDRLVLCITSHQWVRLKCVQVRRSIATVTENLNSVVTRAI